MKKLTVLITLLLLSVIALTLYLPPFEPDNLITSNEQRYILNQDSLKAPLLMSDTSISINMNDSEFYGVQLGMYSQLEQATAISEKYNLADKPTIVKVKGKKRYWYLVIIGPYNKNQAIKNSKKSLSSTLVKWPLTQKN